MTAYTTTGRTAPLPWENVPWSGAALNPSTVRLSVLERQPAALPSPYAPPAQSGSCRDFVLLLSRFDPISLAEMDAVALLDRTDTKYVMSTCQLQSALESLAGHYRVLTIEGLRLIRYRTLYFDTDDFLLYRQHHSGKRDRCKVRSREYVDTGRSFLEVKWKGKRDRTVKGRIQTSDFLAQWLPDASEVLEGMFPPEARSLEAKVLNAFYRTTLVSKWHKERVTLDLGLQFSGDGRTIALPGIAIAEVKQDGFDRRSEFVREMRAAGARSNGFSKYCIGVSLLFEDIKHNRFKPKLRLLSELMGGNGNA